MKDKYYDSKKDKYPDEYVTKKEKRIPIKSYYEYDEGDIYKIYDIVRGEKVT